MAIEHNVGSDDDDIRLDRWFKRHYPNLSHGMLEKRLRKGDVRVDGARAKSSDRLRYGQQIELRFDPSSLVTKREAGVLPQVTEEDAQLMRDLVLYQDSRMVIINKPHGLATQGGSKITRSVDGMLAALAGSEGLMPKLTHRLDRDTSGCLLLARHTQAATAIMKLFAARKIDKTYIALVRGVPANYEGFVELPLRKKDNPKLSASQFFAPHNFTQEYEIMMVDHKEGQKAVTEYRVLDKLASKMSLVELKPHTGRTHQLRVHMQAIGCSIVGDHKYGGSMDDAHALGVENVLHLHAWKISIPGFLNDKSVNVKAPLPPHMRASFDALGLSL